MFKKIIYLSILVFFLSPTLIFSHGDKKHEEKVEKVSALMHEKDERGYNDSLAQVEEKKSMEKDFTTIREDISKSAVPTIIKAVSLAVIIVGLAFLYLPKKRRESTND